MIGKNISHYKILDKLGEGGMGEVYLAEDIKLKRQVALKFLSSKSLSGEEEKNRFMREAQAAAALNHPNIATIFEIDDHEGKLFIAMEHIEGQNLKQLVESGPLKLKDVINISTQIAEGLHAAHFKNIVHRDIKSANIMITDKGQVKIMDFGLAKLSNVSMLTREGSTVGTVSYMSPEQTQGESVDQRTDIWSLGVMMYEMVSGQLPFKGQYDSAVIYSIMHEEAEPLTALRTAVPMELERIILKLMAKDPDNRYQHVNEIPVDLKAIDIKSGSSTKLETSTYTFKTTKKLNRWPQAVPWVIIILLCILCIWLYVIQPKQDYKQVTRFTVPFPKAQYGNNQWENNLLSVSPEGKYLVFECTIDSAYSLYLRDLDNLEIKPISATEEAQNPFISPNGKWIGFYQNESLKKVSVSGGVPQLIVAGVGIGGYWDQKNELELMSDLVIPEGKIHKQRDTLNTTHDFDTELRYNSHNPKLLPGGKAILLTLKHGPKNMEVGVLSVDTGEYQTLIERGANAQYVATGYLIYALEGELLAVPFDLGQLKITGPAVTVVENDQLDLYDAITFSISGNGTLVYARGSGKNEEFSIEWVNHRGVTEPVFTLPSDQWFGSPRVSPDGKWLVLSREEDKWNLWIYDLNRGSGHPLTDDRGSDFFPVWTPDSQWVIFNSTRKSGPRELFRILSDGSGKPEKIIKSEDKWLAAHAISPDGQRLAIVEYTEKTGLDILIIPLEGDSSAQPFLQTEANEYHPGFSPDGHWLAYTSDLSGRPEIYVRPYPGPGAVVQVSKDGGICPVWNPVGKELYYRLDKKMMAVTYRTEPSFQVITTKQLFETDHLLSNEAWQRSYDISPDGRRFLMIRENWTNIAPSQQIYVVVNWFEELKKKMSAVE